MRRLSSLCVVLSALWGCDEPKAAPAPPPPTPRSTLIVADKPVETPTKLAIGTEGESAVRIVPPAMPNSSASATSARAGNTGGCDPSSTDSASERASSAATC